MKGLQSRRATRLVRAAVVGFAATALAVTGAMPAAANELTPDEPATGGQPEPAVHEALQRDLGITAGEVDKLLADLAGVDELEAELVSELGASYGGSCSTTTPAP